MIPKKYKKTIPQMRQHLESVIGFVPESIIRDYAEARKQAKLRSDVLKLTKVVGNTRDSVKNAIKVCKKELKAEMFNGGTCKKCRQSALAKRLTQLESMLADFDA
jgi:hypothetical protein